MTENKRLTTEINGKIFYIECSLDDVLRKLAKYEAIGTIEEFKALKEDKKFLKFLYNHILPNEMEQYLSMYHTKDKIAVNGYADQSGLMSAT